MSKIDEAGEKLKQGAGTAAEATKDAANTAGQKIKNRVRRSSSKQSSARGARVLLAG